MLIFLKNCTCFICRLLDHSLADELERTYKDISEFYYDWAFFRDDALFFHLIDCLRVLGSRDVNRLCELELISAELVKLQP